MGWLRIYGWEAQAYPEQHKVLLSEEQVESYLRKFSRHFKTSIPKVRYWGRFNGGSYRALGNRITLSRPIKLSTIIHEFAHHLNYIRNSQLGHRGKFKRELKRTYTFAKRYPKKKESEVLTPTVGAGIL